MAKKKKKMTSRLDTSKVLIVPGYTDKELIDKNENKKNKNKKNKKQKNIPEPTSFLFEARNIQVQPHRKSYEEFRSAQGLFMMEKSCDEFTQVTMEILVHQNISNTKGSFLIDKEKKELRMRVTDNSIPQDKGKDGELVVGRYVRPEEFTDKYIEIRSNFFKDLDGRPLTIVSPLFEPIAHCVIVDYSYSISEGEEEAAYSVTFQEAATTGF